jgi:hypothetical protein
MGSVWTVRRHRFSPRTASWIDGFASISRGTDHSDSSFTHSTADQSGSRRATITKRYACRLNVTTGRPALAMPRPCVHKLAPPRQRVRSTVGFSALWLAPHAGSGLQLVDRRKLHSSSLTQAQGWKEARLSMNKDSSQPAY